MMYEHNYEIALHAQCRYGDRIESRAVARHHRRRARHPHQGRRGRLAWRLTREIDQKMVARTTERGWSTAYLHRAAQMDACGSRSFSRRRQVRPRTHGSKGIDGEGFKFVLQCLPTPAAAG